MTSEQAHQAAMIKFGKTAAVQYRLTPQRPVFSIGVMMPIVGKPGHFMLSAKGAGDSWEAAFAHADHVAQRMQETLSAVLAPYKGRVNDQTLREEVSRITSNAAQRVLDEEFAPFEEP